MAEKKEIIGLLEELADLLEFHSENQFKISAFRNGANTIRKLDGDINEMVNSGALKEVKGIGKGIYSVIEEFCSHGFSTALDELKKDIPQSLFELFYIRGLGPKKIAQLFNGEQIKSIAELKIACEENKLLSVKGFGEKLQQKICEEIKQLEERKNFLLFHFTENEVEKITILFAEIPVIIKYAFTGEVRRIKEIYSSIEVVVLLDESNTNDFIQRVKSKILLDEITVTKLVSNTSFRLPCIIYPVYSEEIFTKRLFETTGSSEFLQTLNSLSLQYEGNNEQEIFKQLGSGYVAPEMREVEYFSVLKPKLREASLLTEQHLKGFFHFHTTYSDGLNSLEEMVMTAKNIGYSHFAVCDHSKSAFYANGLSESRIAAQKKEIEQFILKNNLPLLQGIETDILANGDLDYPSDILQEIQFVVASVHANFSLSEDDMTKRIIKAVENPFTDVLGHPTGRLLLHRASYKHNIKKIIDACSSNKVAIEINAHPNRLDLDWRNIFYAREKGCLFSINADAHSTENILLAKYGVAIARKGGIQPEEVINCFCGEEFVKFLNRKVTRKVNIP